MKTEKSSYSFLVVGKTQESRDASGSFKRYVGLASSFVLAVNPNKAELDALMGFESQNEPEYVKETDNGKEAHLHFIVRTDPSANNGIELTNRLMFTLRNAPAYNKEGDKVQVIDDFGNHTWVNTEDAKAGKPIMLSNGNPQKIDTKYRMAAVGECDLVDFLKAYLCVQDAFNYVNGVWVKKENCEDYKFKLEKFKEYLKGDFSELKEALAMQPNNKVKLLYGVRTTEDNKQYQVVASRGDLILNNAANMKAVTRLEKTLADAKQNGAYATTDFRVCELQEYVVEPTNMEQSTQSTSEDSSSELPWD